MASGPVVVGVDGSPVSLAAVAWAAEEAEARRLGLRVLHARPLLPHLLPSRTPQDPEWPDGLLATVESGLARSHPRLDVRCVEVVDAAPDALIAASEEAELLVVGTRGRGGFDGLLVGSVSLHAASRAYCPVVTVHQRRPAGDGAVAAAGPHHPEVVLGLDARDPDDAPIAFAFDAAVRRGARLRAVHAWNPPALLGTVTLSGDERDSWQEPELELLVEALRVWRKQYPDLEVVEETVPLGPAEALVNAAARAELLVVGRRQATTPYHPRLGPVAHAVLHHAAAPVAVVPHR